MSEKISPDTKTDNNSHEESGHAFYQFKSEGMGRLNLVSLIKFLWGQKTQIFIVGAVFFTVGYFFFQYGEREFVSTSILIHEDRPSQTVEQQALQSFGISNDGEMAAGGLTISLYPKLIESPDFLLSVITHEVEFQSLDQKISPYLFFDEYYEPPVIQKVIEYIVDYTFKLPLVVIQRLFDSKNNKTDNSKAIEIQDKLTNRFLNLTPEQQKAIVMMRNRITLNRQSNLITFRVQMPDAKAAAELNEIIINQLQSEIIEYHIKKFRQNLEFIERQKEQSRERYESAQLELAQFNDRNVNITTSVARTKQEDLQNRRNITFNVYNNLAQELEQARTRVQEERPVFKVLEKPNLPTGVRGRSNLIVILLVAFGILTSISSAFLYNEWIMLKKKIFT